MVSPTVILVTLLSFTVCGVFGGDNAATLGADETDPDHYDLRRSVRCPGKGNYAVRAGGNCAKYFECEKKGKRPTALKQCADPETNKFNRLSRTCEKAESVKCKWCRKIGVHQDLTSDKHYISCDHGHVATRFKCNKGDYDPATRSCLKTKGSVFIPTEDAAADPPSDIVEFMKDWVKEEKKLKEEAKKKNGSGEDKKKKKKKDSDEEDDDDKKKPEKKGRFLTGLLVASAVGAGVNIIRNKVKEHYSLAPGSGFSNSIEHSDSSEERKQLWNHGKTAKELLKGSAEKEKTSGEKKKKS